MGLGAVSVGGHNGHLTRGHRNDDVVHFMGVVAGGAAGGKPPFGDTNLGSVDLDLGLGGSIFKPS